MFYKNKLISVVHHGRDRKLETSSDRNPNIIEPNDRPNSFALILSEFHQDQIRSDRIIIIIATIWNKHRIFHNFYVREAVGPKGIRALLV